MVCVLFAFNGLKRLFPVFITLLAFSSVYAEPLTLRLLTYNIHHGRGVDGQLDLERIGRVIADASPDIVALQEVDQRANRSARIDQLAELAEQVGMHGRFGPNIKYDGGLYGNAILSRFPVVRTTNHLLPNVKRGEQRGVFEAHLKLSNETNLVLLATHFDHRRDDQERWESAAAINAISKKLKNGMPLVLMGDLNDLPTSRTLNRLKSFWKMTNDQPLATIPVDLPVRQIDYVMVAPTRRWQVVRVEVLDEQIASDHRALLATVKLLDPAAP